MWKHVFKLTKVLFCQKGKIFVTRLSPVSRASPVHVIGPLRAYACYLKCKFICINSQLENKHYELIIKISMNMNMNDGISILEDILHCGLMIFILAYSGMIHRLVNGVSLQRWVRREVLLVWVYLMANYMLSGAGMAVLA